MPLVITQNTMAVEANGTTLATATHTPDGWHVSTWPHPLTLNEAITALTIAERVATHGETDPFVIAWREELAHG
ncbi:hypothetical protein GCM10023085_35890 [Actinomadura viridis]|uniref:Uncharacterized protein n=1 Tax=Actinomadura viridis TaxID=58110 RepID=A0A931GPY4_9ACTN|nr:hypothetical protein [Actinomadura viridis]MBG6087874.1 hypothetical protein [Actinomadura viridis]